MTTTPTGEQLPDYNDDPGPVNPAALHVWLRRRYPASWDGPGLSPVAVEQVLGALQAVGDATLVKNPTYRAMRADGAAVERLNAWLISHGHATAVIEADGDAVQAAIGLLEAVARTGVAW